MFILYSVECQLPAFQQALLEHIEGGGGGRGLLGGGLGQGPVQRGTCTGVLVKGPPPNGQNGRQTRLKTLCTFRNFVGGR